MQKKNIRIIFAFLVLASIIILYFLFTGEVNVIKHTNYIAEFNKTEKEYIENTKTIDVYVENELAYLTHGEDGGFVKEYTDKMLSISGIKSKIEIEKNDADCSIYVVTNSIRDKSNEIIFTSPLFQVEGKLYVNKNIDDERKLKGAAISDRLSEREMSRIKYDGREIDWKFFDSTQEMIAYTQNHNIDCILGDKGSIEAAFSSSQSQFIGAKEKLYTYNACIILDEENEELANIINKCIHSTNRKTISYQLGEKWFGGNGPLYMENDYSDVYALMFIIAVAVLIVFYMYYLSNKNLYRELSDRMNKLTDSKKELQTTFGNIGHCLAEISLEGNIIDINGAFYDLVESYAANRKIWDVLNLGDEEKINIRERILNIRNEGPLKRIELKSGRRTIIADIYPIDNAAGNIEKLLFMAKDVTNERVAERQMLQDNKMIAVGQLAAGVAHEIRNPLGIIRNYCYVLKNIDDEELKEKSISQIENAVDASGAIIDSLLNFSRVSPNTETFVDIEEHISSLILLNNSILKKKNINFTLICEAPVKTNVIVESLDMILINLISNATDAMEENGSLTIKINRYGDTYEIKVKDTGSGIEEKSIKDIFNPFYTTKGDCGGTGLGLYIVYNEIGKMNGNIEVRSKVGEGTEFTITMPLNEYDKGEIDD